MLILGTTILVSYFSFSQSQRPPITMQEAEPEASIATKDLSAISVSGCPSGDVSLWTMDQITTCTGAITAAYQAMSD